MTRAIRLAALIPLALLAAALIAHIAGTDPLATTLGDAAYVALLICVLVGFVDDLRRRRAIVEADENRRD